MSVRHESFGTTPGGAAVDRYTIINAHGVSVSIISYGAVLQSVRVPDRDGKLGNVTLGYDALADYLDDGEFLGRTVGRFANRIGGAVFTLDGVRYELSANEPPNHLHGGPAGFHQKAWVGSVVDDQCVVMRCESADGEAGFPGNVSAAAMYTLTDGNELTMSFEATTDAPTHVNMTNHAYWNLAGAGNGNVLEHMLQIEADDYVEVDEGLIPTGALSPVAGSALDFRLPHIVGERLTDAPLAARWQRGYDHCFVFRQGDGLKPAATVYEPQGGREMRVFTTQPAAMFYTGNNLAVTNGAGGRTFERYGGLCIETQRHPDAPGKPNFPSTVLRPGETYREQTVFRFSVRAPG